MQTWSCLRCCRCNSQRPGAAIERNMRGSGRGLNDWNGTNLVQEVALEDFIPVGRQVEPPEIRVDTKNATLAEAWIHLCKLQSYEQRAGRPRAKPVKMRSAIRPKLAGTKISGVRPSCRGHRISTRRRVAFAKSGERGEPEEQAHGGQAIKAVKHRTRQSTLVAGSTGSLSVLRNRTTVRLKNEAKAVPRMEPVIASTKLSSSNC